VRSVGTIFEIVSLHLNDKLYHCYNCIGSGRLMKMYPEEEPPPFFFSYMQAVKIR